MNSQFIKEVEHMPDPVSIEREEHDVIVIEGVRYSGDLFRTLALPSNEVLYAIRRNEEGVVWVTQIRDVPGALEFFGAIPDPQHTIEQFEGETNDSSI